MSLGTEGGVNLNAKSFVSWLWDAGTSAASTSKGGSASNYTRWTNAVAGFSIIECDHTVSGAATTADHGLGKTPGLIFSKAPDSDNWPWHVFNSGIGTGKVGYLDTSAEWRSDDNHKVSAVSSTQFTYQNYNSDETYLHFVWAEVAGYSAFGSYTGNGSTDGPFIATGVRPRYCLVKTVSAAEGWNVMDTERDYSNPMGVRLVPDTSGTEDSNAAHDWDFLSNGFKIRSSDGWTNGSAATYMYAAFAEHPQKTARAR